MKKGLCLVALAALMIAIPAKSHAHSYDRDDSDHPLRLVAYAFHPIGIFFEYTLLRPIHKFVSSSKDRAIVFGHEPREGDDYDTWK